MAHLVLIVQHVYVLVAGGAVTGLHATSTVSCQATAAAAVVVAAAAAAAAAAAGAATKR